MSFPQMLRSGTGRPVDHDRMTIDYPGGLRGYRRVDRFPSSWEACGMLLLSAPFTVTPCRLAEDGYQLGGPFGCGYITASVGMRKIGPAAGAARCASLSSNTALTEVSFVLEPAAGPALAPDLPAARIRFARDRGR